MDTYYDKAVDFAQPYLEKLADTTPRQRIVTITAALSAVWLVRTIDRVVRPPPALRGLPRVYNFVPSLLTRGVEKTAHTLTIPAAQKHPLGIFACLDLIGWTVHIAHPQAAKQFLRNNDITKNPRFQARMKGTMIGMFLGGPNMAIVQEHDWKKQRKIANPAFHRSMPLDLFVELSQKSFDIIDREGGTLDFHDLMARFTLDAIGRAGFGFDFHALDDKNNDWVRKYHAINDALFNPFPAAFPFTDRYLYWLIPKRARARQDLFDLLGMIENIITTKRKELGQDKGLKESEKDLLTLMLEAENEAGAALSDEELMSNLCLFFVAGHDTTANALSYAIYWLARYPEIQAKAREEVLSVLGNSTDTPTQEQLHAMPYLNRIIRETLRINPPATGTLPRFAARDTEVGGLLIPEGTSVKLDIYEMHRNPAVFKDPEVFNPDREETEGWLPFSSGPRQCIGMNFSLAEQRIMLPLLLQRYTWRLPDHSPYREKLELKGALLLMPEDLEITFERIQV